MPDAALTALSQIPGIAFGLVVVWFALESARRNSDNAKINHAEWRAYDEQKTKMILDALAKQGDKQDEHMEKITAAIEKLTSAVASMESRIDRNNGGGLRM